MTSLAIAANRRSKRGSLMSRVSTPSSAQRRSNDARTRGTASRSSNLPSSRTDFSSPASMTTVTRFTSLVAVEEFPSTRDEARAVRIPNARPGGLLPQGGTDGPLMLMVALGLSLAGAAVIAASLRAERAR